MVTQKVEFTCNPIHSLRKEWSWALCRGVFGSDQQAPLRPAARNAFALDPPSHSGPGLAFIPATSVWLVLLTLSHFHSLKCFPAFLQFIRHFLDNFVFFFVFFPESLNLFFFFFSFSSFCFSALMFWTSVYRGVILSSAASLSILISFWCVVLHFLLTHDFWGGETVRDERFSSTL